jgi:hypothetical protein
VARFENTWRAAKAWRVVVRRPHEWPIICSCLQNPQVGFALNCTGTVLPTEAGSRILATTITAQELLKDAFFISLVSALVALVWTVKGFTWPVFLGATLRFAFFWAVIGFGMVALSRRSNERDYRAILEQLAS